MIALAIIAKKGQISVSTQLGILFLSLLIEWKNCLYWFGFQEGFGHSGVITLNMVGVMGACCGQITSWLSADSKSITALLRGSIYPARFNRSV